MSVLLNLAIKSPTWQPCMSGVRYQQESFENNRGVRTKGPTKFCRMGSCITILSNLVYQELNLCLESLASQFERSILLLGASNELKQK